MGARTRQRSCQRFITDVGVTFNHIESCKDVVTSQPYGQNPLEINRATQEKSRLVWSSGQDGTYPLTNVTSGILGGFPSDSTYVNRMLSQTGPLTPNLYLPLALFELKDLPGMLRHAGNLLHKLKRPSGLDPAAETAAATLAYQFGWKPLIEDMGKLITFGDVVKKRQLMLTRAHSSKGVRRKIILDKQSGAYPVYYSLIHSKLPGVRISPFVSNKKWGTVRWTVKDKTQVGKIASWNEAFKTAYGLNRGHIPIEVWKAIPWTWCIDWFADISNVLQANYNMIYYKPGPVCIMTSYETKHVLDRVERPSNPTQYYEGGSITNERKVRTVHVPVTSVTLKLPFLDSFKLSILGSLTVLKIKGRQ